MTTKAKTIRQQRTVRLHAVREGDELFHDRKWWIVKGHGVEPGVTFKGFDQEGKERIETVGNFNPEYSCALWIARGRHGSVVIGPRTQPVKIIRTRERRK